MLTQLQTPIPLQTPIGKAWAIAIIDYGPDWDLLWVTFVHDTGECWTFNNREIRQEGNYTFGLNHQPPVSATSKPAARLREAADTIFEQNAAMHSPAERSGSNGTHG